MTASKRRLRRFFSSVALPAPGLRLRLSPEETRHLKQIIRLSEGDRCLVTDGKGRETVAEVRSFLEDGTAELIALESVDSPPAAGAAILRMFQGIPKGAKLEWMIQKAQELGLEAFYPLVTERTIVRIAEKKMSPKLARWHKITAEAAKQSGAARLVHLHEPVDFKESLAFLAGSDETAVFHPAPGSISFRKWLGGLEAERKPPVRLNLFLGPEGGFSGREIEHLAGACKATGQLFRQVSLGRTVLKSETAFLAVAAALHLFFEEEK